MTVAGQGDVNEGLALQQLIKDIRQVRLVVVPTQAELLRRSGGVLHRNLKVQQHTHKSAHMSVSSFYISLSVTKVGMRERETRGFISEIVTNMNKNHNS